MELMFKHITYREAISQEIYDNVRGECDYCAKHEYYPEFYYILINGLNPTREAGVRWFCNETCFNCWVLSLNV